MSEGLRQDAVGKVYIPKEGELFPPAVPMYYGSEGWRLYGRKYTPEEARQIYIEKGVKLPKLLQKP